MQRIKKLLYSIQMNKMLKEKSTKNEESSIAVLDDFLSGRTSSPVFVQKTKCNMVVDLMLVVPVYNVETHLDSCIRSILNQKTKYTYIVVFVDDGSTDGSAKILDIYESNSCVKVIHKNNLGVSAARNTGMETMLGRYIMFVDSDDILPEDALEKLLNAAVASDADIVEGNYTTFSSNNRKKEVIHHQSSLKKVQESELSGYAWGKIIRAEIMMKTCFPVGFLYEDTIMTTLVFPSCTSIYTIPDVVYNYRLNPDGIDITTMKKKQVLDTFWVTKYCFEEAVNRGIPLTIEREWKYFEQFRLNWLRLKECSEEIQESVFVLCSHLYQKYFIDYKTQHELTKYVWMRNSLKNKSYCAYCNLMKYWDVLD